MPKGRPANPQLLTDTVTAVREFRQENGYLPSVRELAKLLGRATYSTHRRLRKCVDAGLLRYANGHYIPTKNPSA